MDNSLTTYDGSVTLPLNVPASQSGGYIVVTLEVLPDRIDERMSDEAWYLTAPNEMPNALRDSLRTEPVDVVLNRRIDARHTNPDLAYGFEEMNAKWRVQQVLLGGDFYQPTPGVDNTAQRQALWNPGYVDPSFTDSHYLCPANFPHDVFSVTNNSAFEVVVQHDCAIVGLTQMGDPLMEDNGSYDFVQTAKLQGIQAAANLET